jgi:hypothetical protein
MEGLESNMPQAQVKMRQELSYRPVLMLNHIPVHRLTRTLGREQISA